MSSSISRPSGRRSRILLLALALLLLLVVVAIRYRANPRFIGLGTDSGLFAYAGQRILDGAVLYQDVWDTKPPGVFYINALALALGGGGPWAVWGFETLWFAATMVLLLVLLSYLFGWIPASITTLLVASSALYPGYVEGGNFTETWALLPQILILASAVLLFRTGHQRWLFAIGTLTAVAFLLKPTYIALGLATAVVVAVPVLRGADRPTVLKPIGWFFAGFLLVLLGSWVYWGSQGALGDLWNAVVRQNISYVREGLSPRSLYGTGRRFALEQPMATLTTLTTASFALFLLGRTRPNRSTPQAASRSADRSSNSIQNQMLTVAFLALPLEVIFVAISGRNFGHYYLTPMPAMAVAIAYLFERMLMGSLQRREISRWLAVVLILVGLLLVSWLLAVLPDEIMSRSQFEELLREPLATSYFHDDLERYVLAQTEPDESVLVWGYNPRLHFITGRRAPTGYLFHAQLLTPGSGGEERFDRFLQDLRNDLPSLILAQPQSQHGVPFFGREDSEICPGCTADAIQDMQILRDLVDDRYKLESTIEDWLIYRRNDHP